MHTAAAHSLDSVLGVIRAVLLLVPAARGAPKLVGERAEAVGLCAAAAREQRARLRRLLLVRRCGGGGCGKAGEGCALSRHTTTARHAHSSKGLSSAHDCSSTSTSTTAWKATMLMSTQLHASTFLLRRSNSLAFSFAALMSCPRVAGTLKMIASVACASSKRPPTRPYRLQGGRCGGSAVSGIAPPNVRSVSARRRGCVSQQRELASEQRLDAPQDEE